RFLEMNPHRRKSFVGRILGLQEEAYRGLRQSVVRMDQCANRNLPLHVFQGRSGGRRQRRESYKVICHLKNACPGKYDKPMLLATTPFLGRIFESLPRVRRSDPTWAASASFRKYSCAPGTIRDYYCASAFGGIGAPLSGTLRKPYRSWHRLYES